MMISDKMIGIDLQTFKFLESERQTFEDSLSEILKRVTFKNVLTPKLKLECDAATPWVGKQLKLPHGTKLRMHYKGALYYGEVINGQWELEGRSFKYPSGAASFISKKHTGSWVSLNGWRYWHAQLPGEEKWALIADMVEK